jgi:hypothetical protein
MKLTTFFIVVMIVVVGVYLAGCCGGSKETVVAPPSQSPTTPTLGKQFEDLEQAYKKGAITKEEYETAKKKLLEQK